MRVYVIRHGQTAWNLEGRAQGHTDVPLDEMGLAQARALTEHFRPEAVNRVFCSDLCRCSATAEPLAAALSARLEVRPTLRERSFGEWEGLHFTALRELHEKAIAEKNLPFHEVRPPGGESLLDVWHRLDPILVELECLSDPSVIVSHGATGALLIARLMRGTVETSRSFRFGNTGYSVFDRRPDGLYSLVKYNVTTHLEDLAVLSGSPDGTSR
jgi:2,3-bisphosphoglycerate-dependent phosphoglycerate mutase